MLKRMGEESYRGTAEEKMVIPQEAFEQRPLKVKTNRRIRKVPKLTSHLKMSFSSYVSSSR